MNKREYIFSSRQCQHEAANKSFLGFRRDIKESTIFWRFSDLRLRKRKGRLYDLGGLQMLRIGKF